MFLSNY